MFTTRSIKSIARTALVAGGLGLAALVGAGAANAATAADQAFINALQGDGITAPTQDAINLGHQVCQSLDQGETEQQIVQAVEQHTGMDQDGSHTFAVDAAKAYCPQYVHPAGNPETPSSQTPDTPSGQTPSGF